MTSGSSKKKQNPDKASEPSGEDLNSTQLLHKGAPKVPGIDTGIFFRKIVDKKKSEPGKS